MLIATSFVQVLRRPLESAHALAIRVVPSSEWFLPGKPRRSRRAPAMMATL
jgi:hypothetical protein